MAGLRVLLMPDSTRDNAYQRELAQALEALGVHVAVADFAGALPLLRAARAQAPVDVLHLHWTHPLVLSTTRARSIVKGLRFLAELAALRLRGVRIVWSAHNLVEHERRDPGVELFFGRLAARLYHRIIVHCEAARGTVAAAYGLSPRRQKKLRTIAHGHFIDAYPNEIGRVEARTRLGLAANGPVFVHFGQVRPYKGVFELLDAFAALDAPEATLIIAGKPWDDRLAADLRQRARRDPRIRLFLGFIPDAEVQLHMNAADVVVLPYRDILTSGSAMLAMSFGRAVIMPRCGCAGEMLDGHQDALLYAPADQRGLAQAMRAALGADLRALGEYNRHRAAGFGWHGIAIRTCAAYQGRADA